MGLGSDSLCFGVLCVDIDLCRVNTLWDIDLSSLTQEPRHRSGGR